jgi:hypothetical protein
MLGYRFQAGITEYGRIQCRNAIGATNLILQAGGGNVGIGTSAPGQKLDVSVAGGNNFAGIRSQNSNTGTGIAGIEFSSDATYSKAAIGLLRQNANGQGSLIFYNATSTGAANWSTADERMRISYNGTVNIGGTGADATFMISQGLGGYDRLTQMSPNAASKNAFNIMAAKDGSSTDLWWSWGVRNDNVWVMQEGVNYSLNGGLGFYYDSGGQAYKSGGGTWAASSDVRIKTNITPISDAASRIMALKPSNFDYRVPEAHANRVSDRGFIAQDFEEVYPHSVSESAMVADAEKAFVTGDDKIKAISLNTDFFADIVALVQDQQTTINDLRARVAQLEGN